MAKSAARFFRCLLLTVAFVGATTCAAVAADSSYSLVAPQKVEPGQYFTVTAKLNTNNNEIYGAEVNLHFDPTVVELAYGDLNKCYKQLSGIQSSLVIPKAQSGGITYAVSGSTPIKGDNLEIVEFTLKAKQDGVAQLTVPVAKITMMSNNKVVESSDCSVTGATITVGKGKAPGGGGGNPTPDNSQGTVTLPGTAGTSTGFIDLPQGYWAEQDIASLVYRQIITGFPDGSFKPKQVTTRAQLAVMLTKALDLPTSQAGAGFIDTNKHWASGAIAAVAEANLIQGYQNKFRPDDPVSREELVVIMVRALRWQNDKIPQPTGVGAEKIKQFKDLAQIPAWARQAVSESLELDLVRGVQTDYFGAGQQGTREQVAVLVNKVLKLREAQ